MVNEKRGKKGAQTVEPYWPQEEGVQHPEPEQQFYPQEKFDANLAAWVALIDSGAKTVDQITKAVERGGKLTAGQRARIKPTPVEPESEPMHLHESPPVSDEDPFAE